MASDHVPTASANGLPSGSNSVPNNEVEEDSDIFDIIKFLLHVREKQGITEKTAETIVQEFETMVENCIKMTSDIMDASAIPADQKLNILHPILQLKANLDANNSVQKQQKMLMNNRFVAPNEMNLGEGDSVLYQSILENVKVLLKHADDRNHVMGEPIQTSLQYVVEYQARKLLVKVNKKEEVLSAAVEKFKKKGLLSSGSTCRLEMFCPQLNLHYEVDDDDLPDGGLLKLVVNKDQILSCERNIQGHLSPCISSPVDEDGNQVPGPSSTSGLCVQPCSVDIASTSLCVQPFSTSNRTSSNLGSAVSCSHHKPVATSAQNFSTSLQWPKVFQLPCEKFPPSLKERLDAQKPLSKKNRADLLDCLYNEITTFTFYPSSRNYDAVATALLVKYPYLQESISFDDAKEIWKVRISTKARNTRQRRDSSVSCVVAKRAKRRQHAEKENSSGCKLAKNVPAFGVVNYLPEQLSTEDDVSMSQYQTLMIKEVQKVSPNHRKLDEAMRLTFPHRRNLIVNGNVTLASIKELYPSLFNPNQICFEFTRLTEQDIATLLQDRMLEYWQPILQMREMHVPHCPPELSAEVFIERMVCSALLQVPSLMKESVSFSSIPEEETGPAPMLHFSDPADPDAEGILLAEGVEVCRVKGLLQGVTVWLASYYIFNMSYPNSCRKTLLFIQRGLLGLKDKGKTPLIVLNTIQNLNMLKSANKISDFNLNPAEEYD